MKPSRWGDSVVANNAKALQTARLVAEPIRRFTIHLPEPTYQALAPLAARRGVALAEAIRQALDLWLWADGVFKKPSELIERPERKGRAKTKKEG